MRLATIMPGYLLGANTFPKPNKLTHICVSPGYLLGAKPFPGPMLIYPQGFIFNYTHNEHELDPNLCVFMEHYDISKPACGHWIYLLQIESKQTLFYVSWTVKDRTPAVRVTSFFLKVTLLVATGWRLWWTGLRNMYPSRPVSDPYFRLRRWRAALGQLMLTVRILLC